MPGRELSSLTISFLFRVALRFRLRLASLQLLLLCGVLLRQLLCLLLVLLLQRRWGIRHLPMFGLLPLLKILPLLGLFSDQLILLLFVTLVCRRVP